MTNIVQGEIWHRDDFPLLCLWRRLLRCVEIGVDRAEYSTKFLTRHWNCELYLGIDPYAPYPEMPSGREGDFHIACQRYAPFGGTAKLLKTTSREGAQLLSAQKGVNALWGNPWDFVYIDAEHSREAVSEDMATWWNQLSDKGILAGHDWDTADHPGVQQAVYEFAARVDRSVYVTYLDHPQSWYLYKNNIPSPEWERRL